MLSRLPIPGKRILAVEMAGSDIRAAVVQSKGRKCEIVDFATLKRPDSQEDLIDVPTLKSLAERLGVSGGAAVFVSPMARAFELLMDRSKIKSLNSYQLCEAVKWETEPYTGISGQVALIGVEARREPKAKPGEIVYDEIDQTTVNVTVVERNVYRAIRERFKVAGFTLARIYPPEACFYYALSRDNLDTPRAILEVGPDYSNFAVLSGGLPLQINTLSLSQESIAAHISGESVSQELVESLRFTIRQVPEPEPLILSGPGAADAKVAAFIADLCPGGAQPLELSRLAGVADTRGDASHAVFGTVVGAALRELGGPAGRQVGVNDSVPLGLRIRRSAYLVPVVVTVLLLLVLAGHFVFMKYQIRNYEAQIAKHRETLKQHKANIAAYEEILAQREEVTEQVQKIENRLNYMENLADKEMSRIIACIQDMGAVVPPSVSLESIIQNGESSFKIVGSAFSLDGPTIYGTAIQEQDWCEAVTVEKITADGKGGKRVVSKASNKAGPPLQKFDFEITVRTKTKLP